MGTRSSRRGKQHVRRPHPRFDVFARIVEVRREGAQWQVYRVGVDGKRTPVGFVVPDFSKEEELAQFLEDPFHECVAAQQRRVPHRPTP